MSLRGTDRVAPEKDDTSTRLSVSRLIGRDFRGSQMKKHIKSKSSYWEKLKDPRWQKKRLEVMELRNFECEDCGDGSKTLNVHHRAYKKNADPWDYDESELMCLCEDCHKKEHVLGDMLTQALYEYKTESGGIGLTKERLIGYLQGPFWGDGPWREWIQILGWEHAFGVAQNFNVPTEEAADWLCKKANENNGKVHHQEFSWRFFPEERASAFRNLAKEDPNYLKKLMGYDFFHEWPESVRENVISAVSMESTN
jgi:hypothetical protein